MTFVPQLDAPPPSRLKGNRSRLHAEPITTSAYNNGHARAYADPITSDGTGNGCDASKLDGYNGIVCSSSYGRAVTPSGTPAPQRLVADLPNEDHSFLAILASCVKPLRGYVEFLEHLQEPEREGCLAGIVASHMFSIMCTLVIVLNCAFTWVSTNYQISTLADPPASFKTIEAFFLMFYSVELALKAIVHKWFFFVSEDMQWNMFDAVLVLLGIVDWVLSTTSGNGTFALTFMRSLRILKIVKILRIFRLVRFLSQLRLILSAIIGSATSLFWSIVLMMLMFFIFGLVFVQGVTSFFLEHRDVVGTPSSETLLGHFGSVEVAMLSLYKATTGGDDWSLYYDSIAVTGVFNAFMFLFFMAFIHLAFINILTGVFVDGAMKLAVPDARTAVSESRKSLHTNAEELCRLCLAVTADGSRSPLVRRNSFSNTSMLTKLDGVCIDRDLLFEALEDPMNELRVYLESVGIDRVNVQRYFTLLQEGRPGGVVTIDGFVRGILKIRAGSTALDIMEMCCVMNAIGERVGVSSHAYQQVGGVDDTRCEEGADPGSFYL